MNLTFRFKILISLTLLTGFPFSCDFEECEGGKPYRIESYSFNVGARYNHGDGFFLFEMSDSIHISEFQIELKADEFLTQQKINRFGLINSAYACSPSFRHNSPINDIRIYAADTLCFNRSYVVPGTDLSDFFELQNISFNAFSEYNEMLYFGFSEIPNKAFATSFRYELDYDSPKIKTIYRESTQVLVYF
ncbi:MAG: hypothetical protein ACJA08_000489 [Cyclobacteriaceae bacterium]|jgi:hypothetical protein